MTQPLDYWSMLYVFVLAAFIGLGVIRRVSRLLHTPLMSITNAISGIAVIGSIIVAAKPDEGDMRSVSHVHNIPWICAGLNGSRGAYLTLTKQSLRQAS